MTRSCVGTLGVTTALWLGSLVVMSTTALAGEAENTDLIRFLPNHGNSIYSATGLLRQWPAGGPKELWRVEIGLGKSAVVEAGGLAFTATETDKKQWALCLDPLTGATRWKHGGNICSIRRRTATSRGGR